MWLPKVSDENWTCYFSLKVFSSHFLHIVPLPFTFTFILLSPSAMTSLVRDAQSHFKAVSPLSNCLRIRIIEFRSSNSGWKSDNTDARSEQLIAVNTVRSIKSLYRRHQRKVNGCDVYLPTTLLRSVSWWRTELMRTYIVLRLAWRETKPIRALRHLQFSSLVRSQSVAQCRPCSDT